MAKISKNMSFKNFSFRVTKDELSGEKRIMILEMTKDEDIWTDFEEVLEFFADEDGLSMSIKAEKGFNQE